MRREDEIDIARSKDQSTYLLPPEQDGTSKIVQFKPTGWRGIYALGVGIWEDGMPPGKVSQVGLGEEFAARLVLMTMISFTDRFPRRHILFMGHSPVHSRRYRMLITRYFEQISAYFTISGIIAVSAAASVEVPFDSRHTYVGFTFRRKPN